MRIALDTNQLVRALMRPPQLATIVMAWEARRFTVVGSAELLDEYERVLAYPDIAALIDPELLRAFRSHLVHDIELVALPEIPRVCRDPADDKVLATALFGEVDELITADEDLRTPELLALLREAGIGVLSIDALIALLDRESGRGR
jgi:putative PIN family toxin of toxin-antitoxin system